jgi:small-conductance mechanosensitive channel
MLAAHAVTAAATSQWVGAGVALGTALLVLWVIRTVFFTPRTRRLAEAVLRGELTPEVDTRLRLLERAVYALVLTVGIATALSQFDGVRDIGRALLTSGAIAAAIVGFAARQTLANVVAGLMIAITQPLRLGDHVAFEDHSGVVEDVTLSYTTLRTGAGSRIVIPNEKLTSAVLRNDSLVDAPVAPEVSVWIAPDADAARALEVLADEEQGLTATIAEATPEGIRMTVTAPAVAPPDRGPREAEMRAVCLAHLHAQGLLPAS